MATYKVLQDIEAEDKLVGPLTLRQFIYAAVTLVCLYICFLLATKGAPFLVVIFLPPALISGFFAFPWGREQPTEIWALARIRFMLKPRRRIWDQSGVKELVTVTAPKRVEVIYTDGLSQNEVAGRLKALADTIDSRGWAIKNVNPAMQMQATTGGTNTADPDRLVGVNVLPQVQPAADVQPADDMLDEQNNPVARQFDQMLEKSDVDHRERIKLEMSQASASSQAPASTPGVQTATPTQQQNDYWFLNQAPTTGPAQVVTPNEPASAVPATVAAAEPTADEKALAQQFKEQNKDSIQISYGHMRTIQPLSTRPKPAMQPQNGPGTAQPPTNTITTSGQPAITTKPANPPVTHQPNPDTLKYVNNDDLTVATIARQVNENPPDEVVISLH